MPTCPRALTAAQCGGPPFHRAPSAHLEEVYYHVTIPTGPVPPERKALICDP